jgi:hypothetical protein
MRIMSTYLSVIIFFINNKSETAFKKKDINYHYKKIHRKHDLHMLTGLKSLTIL